MPNKKIILSSLVAFMLISCLSANNNAQPTNTYHPIFAVTPTKASTPGTTMLTMTSIATQPSPISISTLRSYSTPVNLFDVLDQITDDKLLLTIEDVDSVCHSIREPIEIRFSFKNLTEDIINIPDQFVIAMNQYGAGGNIIKYTLTTSGERLYTSFDKMIIDGVSPSTDKYRSIPPHQTFETAVKYYFPDALLESFSSEPEKLVTPAPGNYRIRFVYTQSKLNGSTWHGFLGSNQLEICIVH